MIAPKSLLPFFSPFRILTGLVVNVPPVMIAPICLISTLVAAGEDRTIKQASVNGDLVADQILLVLERTSTSIHITCMFHFLVVVLRMPSANWSVYHMFRLSLERVSLLELTGIGEGFLTLRTLNTWIAR